MPKTGRPKAELVLTDEERDSLVRWLRRAKSSRALALRCRNVLACTNGVSNVEVARKLGVARPTVGKPESTGEMVVRWCVWDKEMFLDLG